MPEYKDPDDDIEVFPFSYEKIAPAERSEINSGFLYDFGKETFGSVVIEELKSDGVVYYGESREEALSGAEAVLRESVGAGVKITSVGGKTFDIRPNPGLYREFSAAVPVGTGRVEVTYKNGELTVLSTVDGGTVYFKDQVKTVKANIPTVI